MKKPFYVFIVFSLFVPLCLFATPTKRAIVVGASSGIGRAIAKELASEYIVGLVARRTHLLKTLQQEITTPTIIKTLDITKNEDVPIKLAELIDELGGLDLLVITASAFGQRNKTDEFETLQKYVAIDIVGFSTVINTILHYFEQQKSGHIVGITSIDALRGNATGPVYCGIKAYGSLFLEGIRNKMIQNKLPIHVTEIRPGWVDVEHTTFSKQPGTYWVAKVEEAAKQICTAIKKKKKVAYVKKQWTIIAVLMKTLPDWLYNRIGGL